MPERHGAEGEKCARWRLRSAAPESSCRFPEAPQDDRLQAILIDRHAQRPSRPDQRLLPDEFVERARALMRSASGADRSTDPGPDGGSGSSTVTFVL